MHVGADPLAVEVAARPVGTRARFVGAAPGHGGRRLGFVALASRCVGR